MALWAIGPIKAEASSVVDKSLSCRSRLGENIFFNAFTIGLL